MPITAATIRDIVRRRPVATLGAIAAVGIVLRLRQYLYARSLWGDEISLARSIRDLGVFEIALTELAHGQSAPPAFLIASKLAVEVVGLSEYGLRLFPLLAGVATVILSVLVAIRLLSNVLARACFVALIAFSPTLIYYSNEVKQYSTDVLALTAVLLLWSYRESLNGALVLGVGGLVVAVISLPGIVGLLAIGLALLVEHTSSATRPGSALPRGAATWRWTQREWTVLGVMWGVGVGLHGLYSLRFGASRDSMSAWWGERGAFPPESPLDISELGWYPLALMRLAWLGIGEEGRVGATGATGLVVVVVVVVGLSVVGLRHRRDLRALTLFTLGIAWVLAELRIFPSSGRTSLYLLPVIFLLLACGLESIVERGRPGAAAAGLAAAVVLLSVQLSLSLPGFLSPLNDRDMKWVTREIESRFEPDDAIVFERWSWAKSWYVDSSLDPTLLRYVISSDETADDLASEIDLSEHHRLWIASADPADRPERLAALLDEATRFTTVCSFSEGLTYLGLLVREDLVDDLDPDEVCALSSRR